MQPVSRRRFLQLTGVALAGGLLPRPEWAAVTMAVTHGRALKPLTVHSAPGANARVVSRLWPDSVIALKGRAGAWYRTQDGYVERAGLQPVLPYRMPAEIRRPAHPFAAVVAAPVTALRAWADADAPLITRIGHGGGATIVDALPPAAGGTLWYGIASVPEGGVSGWSPAHHWRPAAAFGAGRLAADLHIDRAAQMMRVVAHERAILRAPVATAPDAPAGTYAVEAFVLGARVAVHGEVYHGVPCIEFGRGRKLAGAYWHNDFGQTTTGPDVQVTPLCIQPLFQHLNGESRVIIV